MAERETVKVGPKDVATVGPDAKSADPKGDEKAKRKAEKMAERKAEAAKRIPILKAKAEKIAAKLKAAEAIVAEK
jgi:hypothetical protein